MTVIKSAAHFVLCTACTLHGTIVCADGTKGAHIATKTGGEKEIERLLGMKKITPEEVPELKRQMEQAFEWIGTGDKYLDLNDLEQTLQALEELHGALSEAALDNMHWALFGMKKPDKNHRDKPPTLH